MDNAAEEDWESAQFDYNWHYKAIEPGEFERWWDWMESIQAVPNNKKLEGYWKAKKWALKGWIAREQGWYLKP
jgi:hypothetical protein